MNDKSRPLYEDGAMAVASHVQSLLPPLPSIEVALRTAEQWKTGDMGPDVILPALWVQIIASAYQAEILTRQREALEAKLSRPLEPMTDDVMDEVAVDMANLAAKRTFQPSEAAGVLYRAATIIAVAHIPPERALKAIDEMAAIARADVADAIGHGATKQ